MDKLLIFSYYCVLKLAVKLFWMRFMSDNSEEKTYIENMSDDDRDIDIESDVCESWMNDFHRNQNKNIPNI